MKVKKRSIQGIIYVLLLLVAIIILFQWYTRQNERRMEERNKNYATDSARLTATKIDEEFKNALDLINTYTYFLGESMSEPVINAKILKEMESNSQFDALMFSDVNGKDYASDGRTANVVEREFFQSGISGESGIEIVFESNFFDETMANFYAPVRYKGEIIGVLRGAYLAEEYLRDMLYTTYFGEEAGVFLCMPDGRAIASSDDKTYTTDLLDILVEGQIIDIHTADEVRKVFENGQEGAFVCEKGSKIDNICAMYLPNHHYVLVQTFPENITQNMIKVENIVSFQLEASMFVLFAIYVVALIIRAGSEKKVLERENQEMGYIISGVRTLFSRFTMVDFKEDTYQYLSGSKPQDENFAISGKYQDFVKYLSSFIIEEDQRQEFVKWIDKA